MFTKNKHLGVKSLSPHTNIQTYNSMHIYIYVLHKITFTTGAYLSTTIWHSFSLVWHWLDGNIYIYCSSFVAVLAHITTSCSVEIQASALHAVYCDDEKNTAYPRRLYIRQLLSGVIDLPLSCTKMRNTEMNLCAFWKINTPVSWS